MTADLKQKRDAARTSAAAWYDEAARLEAAGKSAEAERAREKARDYDHAANMYQGTIDTIEGNG